MVVSNNMIAAVSEVADALANLAAVIENEGIDRDAWILVRETITKSFTYLYGIQGDGKVTP